jgi:hypothetical protein
LLGGDDDCADPRCAVLDLSAGATPLAAVVVAEPEAIDGLNGHQATNGHARPERGVDPATAIAPATAAHAIRLERPPLPEWSLLVRLVGPVDVVDAEGDAVRFEKSKALELVTWLATHRTRSSRAAARTALWDLDVRDATFANVVSDARRSLARHLRPPSGEEWVRRTLTEELVLHDGVVSDAEVTRVPVWM